MEVETLRDLYENASVLAHGYPFKYNGYTLKKSGGGGSTEFFVLNQEHEHVETISAKSRGSTYEDFEARLDSIIEDNPEPISDRTFE